MMHCKSYRWAGAVVAAFSLFATTVAGQPQRSAPVDPIESAKSRQSIAAQKAEADILQTIENADRLAKGNLTAKALQSLRTAKSNLQSAVGLSEAGRTRLTGLLDAKMAAIEGRAAGTGTTGPNTSPGFKLDPRGAEVKASKDQVLAGYFAELKDVRLGIERVSDYQAKGQTANANAEIARLSKAYPNNPSVLALGYNDTLKNRISDAQAHYAAMSDRWVKNQQNINKSALPAIYDVEFPKDWKQISERRLNSYNAKLSTKEKKIIEALDKPMTVNFQDRPFDEALQDLSTSLDLPLLIDKKSLDDLGLDLKKGSTLQARGLSGRTVLRAILASQGLTFVIKDETVQIMTIEKAKSMLTTKVYYLGDLVQGVGQFGGIQWGPFLNVQQTQANVAALIEMIKKIEPLSWNGEAGGAGSITYHAATQSIIVRNSTEVHHLLGNAFSGQR
jgi:hypothetical protein